MIALFLAYLRAHLKTALMMALVAAIFVLLLSLYQAPLDAILYALVLSVASGATFLCIGFSGFLRRHRDLMLLRPEDDLSALPPPRDLIERDYRALLGTARALLAERSTAWAQEKRDITDYYALWAHQIKTPIAASRLLLESPELRPDALRAELFLIEEYVGMALAYMRLGEDASDYVFSPCALDALLRSCFRKYARLFILRKLTLTFEETHLTVLTDGKWLHFVIEQCLSNALKYTPKGGIAVRAEGQTLFIEDTGIGICPEDLPRVFEKGYTGYNGRAHEKSTGIGLYLCKRVCDRLGIAITIASEPSRGTRVALRFAPESVTPKLSKM